jgi:hypothetical protein
LFELSAGLELGVRYRHNIDLWQRMADERPEMLREGAKCIIAALERCVSVAKLQGAHGSFCKLSVGNVSEAYLETMNEDEQECFAHAHQLPSMASRASSLTSGKQSATCWTRM